MKDRTTGELGANGDEPAKLAVSCDGDQLPDPKKPPQAQTKHQLDRRKAKFTPAPTFPVPRTKAASNICAKSVFPNQQNTAFSTEAPGTRRQGRRANHRPALAEPANQLAASRLSRVSPTKSLEPETKSPQRRLLGWADERTGNRG